MKTRRLSLALALALLAALLVVAPVQAGKPQVAEFVASSTLIYIDVPYYTTGGVDHGSNSWVEVITSEDTRYQGIQTSHYECIGLVGHPQSTDIYAWGPCNGTWRLEVTGSDGWWEGQAHGMPQSDQRALLVRATGRGYGTFAGMKVEWTQADISDWGARMTVRITAK